MSIGLFYLGAVLVGAVLWDLVYSLLETQKYVSNQPGYFVMKGKNYSLTTRQIYIVHITRIFIGLGLLITFN